MLPSLVSQLVVLLKDTSLGFVIGFSELLRTGGQLGQVLNNPILLYLAVALILHRHQPRALPRSPATSRGASAARSAVSRGARE
jgi:hypothetical protein